MSQQATSLRIGEALEVIKAMDLLGDEWSEPRELGRRAFQECDDHRGRQPRDTVLRKQSMRPSTLWPADLPRFPTPSGAQKPG
jgi:hypothetical protein